MCKTVVKWLNKYYWSRAVVDRGKENSKSLPIHKSEIKNNNEKTGSIFPITWLFIIYKDLINGF